MERRNFLLSVKSAFEQEIKNYQGPDPLKIRCDYLNSLEKDESDFACDIYTSVLQETLQIFKSDSRYRQDLRYVKLWLRYIPTQRNPLDMFNKLYNKGLGIECADFWIAWVSYLLKNEDYLTADKVLTMGLNNEVIPKCVIEKAYEEFLKEVGRKLMKGQICCSICGSAFQCAGKNYINGKEASDKIGWEYNPLECGERDDFSCPMAYFEDPDPKKIRMYPFEEVYPNKLKEVCLELVLLKKFEEMRAKKEELKKRKELEIQMTKAKLVENPKFDVPKIEKPTQVQATISAPTNLLNMIKMDHSINNTNMTVHTKEAMNVVQDMWNSPTPNQARPRQLFGEPQTTEEVASYLKPLDENVPPFGHQPVTAPVSRKLFSVYTEDDEEEAAGGSAPPQTAHPPASLQPVAFSAKLSLSTKGKTPLGERSEGRGPAPCQEDQLTDRFQKQATLHPQPQTPQWQPFQDKNDDFSDVTCNTKAFDFILPSSTPVNKRTFSSGEKVEDNTLKKVQSENLTNLSVIYEASKERCSTTDSNSSGSVHPKTPRSTPRIGDPKIHSPFDPTFSYLKTPPFRPSSVAQTFLRTIAEEPDTSSVLFSDPSVLVNTPPGSLTSSKTFTLPSKYNNNSCDQMNMDFDQPGSPFCRFSVSEVRRSPLINRCLKSRLLARNKRALQKASFRPVEKENLSPGMLGFPSSSFAQINFEDPVKKPSKTNYYVIFNFNDKENIKPNSSAAIPKATGKADYQCKIIDINGNPKCDPQNVMKNNGNLECFSTNDDAVSPLKSIQKTVERPSQDTVCSETDSPKSPIRCSSKKNSVIGRKLSRDTRSSNITESSELKSTASTESFSTKICLQNTVIDLIENGNQTRKTVYLKDSLVTSEDLPQTQMNSSQNEELHRRTSINTPISVQNSGQGINYNSPKDLRKKSIRRSSKKYFTDDARRRKSRNRISNITIEGSEFRNIDNSDSLPKRCLRSSLKYGTSIIRKSGFQTGKTSYSKDSLGTSAGADRDPLSQKTQDGQTQASSTQKKDQWSCQYTELSSVKYSTENSTRRSTNDKETDIVPLRKASKDGFSNSTQDLRGENVHDMNSLSIRCLRKSSKQEKSIVTKESLNETTEASHGTNFCKATTHIVDVPLTGASNQKEPRTATAGKINLDRRVTQKEKSMSNVDEEITLIMSNDDFMTALDSKDVANDQKNDNLELAFFRPSFVNSNNILPGDAPKFSGIQTKSVQKHLVMDSIENFAQGNDCSSKNSRKGSKRRSSKKVSAIGIRRSSRRKDLKVNQYSESESGEPSELGPRRCLRKSSKQEKSILTKESLNQTTEASHGTDFCKATTHIVDVPQTLTGASNQKEPRTATAGKINLDRRVTQKEKSMSNVDEEITLIMSNDDFMTALDSKDVANDQKNDNLELAFFRPSFVNSNNIRPSNAPNCSGIQTKTVQKHLVMDSIENFAQGNDCFSKNSRKSSKRRSSKKVSAIDIRRSSRRKDLRVNQYSESESGEPSKLGPKKCLRNSSRYTLKDAKGSGNQTGQTGSSETCAQTEDQTFLSASTTHDSGLMITKTELVILTKSTRYALRRRNCNLKKYKEQDETINQGEKSVYDSDHMKHLHESDYNYKIKNSEGAVRKYKKKSLSKKSGVGLPKKYSKRKNKCTVTEGFDPFSQKTIEDLLDLVNFPKAFPYEHYYSRNSNVPSMTKIVKIGDVPYTILGDIGKGVYARVLKASRGNEILALKLEKPACKWEFYIAKEIQRRRGSSSMKLSFMDIRAAHIYNNGSILEIDYAKYGTLVDIINLHKKKTGKGLDVGVAMHYAIEVLDIVDYLHKCKIIHADLKPDNFVVRELPAYKESEPCVQLIDFGRCIDMTLFPPETKFHTIFKTEDNKCNEMKDNKPWTYQIDLYGLASVFYCLLSGEYLKVLKKNNKWGLQKPIPRNMKRELWSPIFDTLLNLDSCEDMPMSLTPIRISLMEAYESSVPSCQLNIKSFNNVISNSV